jgi:hypothetical protein
MKRTAALFSLGSEFDPFLLAPISDDHTGMPLTVLSALARLDVDPWEEASVLARLPQERATVKLASLLATLPAGPSARADVRSIAVRLIALLPRHVVAAVSAPTAVLPPGHVITRSPLLSYLLLYSLLVLFTLAAQWLIGPPRVAPPASIAAEPASASTAPPPAPMAPPPTHSGP